MSENLPEKKILEGDFIPGGVEFKAYPKQKARTSFLEANVSSLVPYANNSRNHSQKQVDQIVESIKEFGFTNPIIFSEDGRIIAGHGRVLAAEALGIETIPCIYVEGWTESQKRAYTIADNKLALNATWHSAMLEFEFIDLKEDGFDLEKTGFDQFEILELMSPDEKPKATGDKNSPEVVPDIVLCGDWVLGNHRLSIIQKNDLSVAEDAEYAKIMIEAWQKKTKQDAIHVKSGKKYNDLKG